MHCKFLKANNPLYADTDVNEQWLEAAMANDEELCKHLVVCDDNREMDTECEQPENDGCDSPTNLAVNVDSEPIICDDNDEFATALRQLN